MVGGKARRDSEASAAGKGELAHVFRISYERGDERGRGVGHSKPGVNWGGNRRGVVCKFLWPSEDRGAGVEQ